MIDNKNKRKGSVLLVSVFISVLFAAIVIGMMQLNTEEAMLTNNYIELTKAIAIAEAGLNDAYYCIRQDRNWSAGFTNKAFADSTYSVTISGSLPDRSLVSTGTTSAGYKARVDADITVGSSAPYSVRIIEIRIND
jgi:Tfp pilus assembly protein PilX